MPRTEPSQVAGQRLDATALREIADVLDAMTAAKESTGVRLDGVLCLLGEDGEAGGIEVPVAYAVDGPWDGYVVGLAPSSAVFL